MGQKGNPIGFRLSHRKDWKSLWYAPKQTFAAQLVEDMTIRQFLHKNSMTSNASSVIIRRLSDKIEVTIITAMPGRVIGKKGVGIEELRALLNKRLNKEVWLEVEEVKRPDLDSKSIGDSIARQLEKRIPYRRALKKAIQSAMEAGALGVKVQASGRLGGAEIARAEWYKEGSVPLHTIKADIDYAQVRAETTYGTIGIQVWVHRGEMEHAPKEKRVAR
jgi:small subunit ribosomal protein S3